MPKLVPRVQFSPHLSYLMKLGFSDSFRLTLPPMSQADKLICVFQSTHFKRTTVVYNIRNEIKYRHISLCGFSLMTITLLTLFMWFLCTTTHTMTVVIRQHHGRQLLQFTDDSLPKANCADRVRSVGNRRNQRCRPVGLFFTRRISVCPSH